MEICGIETAKEKLKGIDIKFFLNGMTEQSNYIVDKADEINIAIDVILSELEKKDRIIKEMAKTINKEYYKDIIENYTKKVEGK